MRKRAVEIWPPRQPTLSPDKDWLVFPDCGIFPQPISLYAYHLATNQLVYLGADTRRYLENDLVEVERWVDDTHPIVQIYGTPTPSDYDVFIADLTQTNSLKQIVAMESQWPLDGEDTLEWFPYSQFGDHRSAPYNPDDCRLHRFDLKTEKLTVLPVIPGVCGGIPITDGSGDYLYRSVPRVETGMPKTAELIRYNPLTGKSHDLFTGEIEWLQGFSPDGRYALLILDNNGKIEYPLDWEPDQYPWDEVPSAWSAIFDLQTEKVIYTMPGVANVYIGYSPYIAWLNDHQMLVSRNGWEEFKPMMGASIVTLQDPITETPINGGVLTYFGDDLLLRQDSGDNSQINLYNIPTDKTQPITRR